MKVWKFKLDIAVDPDSVGLGIAETTVEVPRGAEILEVGVCSTGACFLALVDPDAEVEDRTFIVAGNGVDLPEGISGLHFRGSVKLPGLSLSVFETTEVAATA